ncbi:enoyl-CoA hydratase/isomerase family protein [Noviherbaspirillum sp.]|uniref:enoyl-CoA hydratase/isomerase family protein n=1 Tax=Noviherbaspirillum sp. TaxID=1926288 RepID=UPI002B4A4E5E|nr:enoyl-CoA hydratase-related protein [Noviherbaspirillum sp.]HJV81736.1 enoyl-CoA hydratase-related protein [Noviherbaspirillum sp.]
MSEIRIEKKDVVATVVISNPRKLNAINVAMWNALAHAFTVLSQDELLRCVIVRGDDHHFAAGADVEEFSTVRNTMAQGIRYHTETIAQALYAISHCQHPTIAAIEGICVGGGLEIACACDLRIAAPSARFGIPINRLGFPLVPGELQHLLQLVGKAVVLEILLEGRVFDAAEAKDKGLIHRVADDVPAEAVRTAKRIAQGAPLAARMNKHLVNRLAAQPEPLTDQELREAFAFLASQDYREGVQTFLAKRKPVFSGK